MKNSARTKRRHNKIRKDLEKQGYFSVKDWFSKAKGPAQSDILAQVDEDLTHKDLPVDLDLDCDSDVEMIAANNLPAEKECISEESDLV